MRACVCVCGAVRSWEGGFLSLELASTCGVNMCNPSVCLCVFASVDVCLWWSWRLLLLLWERHSHPLVAPSCPPPLLPPPPRPPPAIYRRWGVKAPLSLCSHSHTETITLLTGRTDPSDTHTHSFGTRRSPREKRLSGSAASPQLEGLRTEKRRGESTIGRSISIIFADRLRRLVGTAHTFGGKRFPFQLQRR